MPYTQLVTPNLSDSMVVYQYGKPLTDWLGWCLAVAWTAFGGKTTNPTAWDAWTNSVKYKHADWNLPSGVYVPVWFSGYQGMGHVAIYKDGKVWSSPYTHKPYMDVLNSIADVERIYGVKYVGWSEDIGSVRVVKDEGSNGVVVGSEENWYGRLNKLHMQVLGAPLGRDTFAQLVGKDTLTVIEIFSDHPNAPVVQNWQDVGQVAVRDNWQGQINNLVQQVNELNKRPTQEQLDALGKQAEELKKTAEAAQKLADDNAKKLEEAQAKASEDTKLLDETGNWLMKLFKRLFNR